MGNIISTIARLFSGGRPLVEIDAHDAHCCVTETVSSSSSDKSIVPDNKKEPIAGSKLD